MPLFPVIDIESLVQEEDKTRINVAQSYASGANAITSMMVKPSKTVDAIEVIETGYLDWQYPFTFEIIEDENDKINFSEDGGVSELTAQILEGEYTPEELADAIQSAMNGVGALTYEVTVSETNEFTIEAESEFSLLVVSGTDSSQGILGAVGFSEDQEGEKTYTGEEVKTITKVIELTVANDDDPTPLEKVITREIEVISEVSDRLFSSDDKLRKHEADIMKYLPEGRATFKDVHRRAQTLILAWLDTHGFIDDLNDKLVVESFTDREEVTEWATMMTLRLIFESVKNATDDVFSEKAKKYNELEDFYRNRATIKVDLNKDGVADVAERLDIRSCTVVRR